jgi:hypothetical protein
MYTIVGDDQRFNVYIHYDGYPSGALKHIKAALPLAWDLPRFEADEFAAAFVAGNKSGGGGVRLMHDGAPKKVAPGDIEYRYEIIYRNGGLSVAAFAVENWNAYKETPLFSGTFDQFAAWAIAHED